MRRRGFSLVEVTIGLVILMMGMLGLLNLYLYGARSITRTTIDTNLSQRNAQGLRRMSEQLRMAMSVELNQDGTTVTYQLPAMSDSIDPFTGEHEVALPRVWDGVTRSYSIEGGILRDDQTGQVLVEGLALTDPDPDSSQYGQTYAPFAFSTIGSSRALSIQLITSQFMGVQTRFARLKTTVMLRNMP